ncbi:MAG: hypothetical protein DWQ44_00335 [Bacteroidetes bacterium]|nr:MAG: hypothetical protein DWQ33_03710 [Bacteroidota bacterium]REK07605.1 MAG: hypothetical protein DWQ39_01560 [Bacteroidota bacterium]REK36963.1 MAG: hypothetical protein DWQ44_00335 [Bacteroidota bacterium]REK47783.1 MAG: hypothetical protein DWQ48_11395 [Bacteroidota bacterium]
MRSRSYKLQRSNILNRYNAGESRQGIYNNTEGRSETIAEILLFCRPQESLKKIKSRNVLLISLMSFALAFEIAYAVTKGINHLNIQVIIVDLALLSFIIFKKARYYSWIYFRAILSTFVIIVMLIIGEFPPESMNIWFIVYFSLFIPIAILAINLENLILSGVVERNEEFIDEKGKNRTRKSYLFTD